MPPVLSEYESENESSIAIEVTPFSLDEESVLPLALARSWLSKEELERAAAFRFEVHRDRYVRGRGMMRALLARRLGGAPGSLAFAIGEKGKPSLVGVQTGFNLSHSEGRAVLAIGPVEHLGVDIEGYDRRVDHAGLARRCFRDSEIAWMERFTPDERHLAFFRIWTSKEARMKATGEGFQLAPQRIELEFADGFAVRCLEPVDPPAHLVAVKLPDEGAACAVVALAPIHVVLGEVPSWG
jgi:4'-phosphopantetheinyl transferase